MQEISVRLVHNKENQHLIFKIVMIFFVWDILVSVALIYLRQKLRNRHRKINSAIVVIIQILTLLELFGIGALYYLVQ